MDRPECKNDYDKDYLVLDKIRNKKIECKSAKENNDDLKKMNKKNRVSNNNDFFSLIVVR